MGYAEPGGRPPDRPRRAAARTGGACGPLSRGRGPAAARLPGACHCILASRIGWSRRACVAGSTTRAWRCPRFICRWPERPGGVPSTRVRTALEFVQESTMNPFRRIVIASLLAAGCGGVAIGASPASAQAAGAASAGHGARHRRQPRHRLRAGAPVRRGGLDGDRYRAPAAGGEEPGGTRGTAAQRAARGARRRGRGEHRRAAAAARGPADRRAGQQCRRHGPVPWPVVRQARPRPLRLPDGAERARPDPRRRGAESATSRRAGRRRSSPSRRSPARSARRAVGCRVATGTRPARRR